MRYLVSIASAGKDEKALKRYVESLSNLGDSIDKLISVEFPGYISDVYPLSKYLDCTTLQVQTEPKYPGNLFRFAFFPMGINRSDTCVFTDTHDIFFQGPIKIKDNKKIYVGSEHILWKDTDFWRPILEKYNVKSLMDKPVYNMGAWIMPFYKAYDLMNFLRKNYNMFDGANWSDQILYNLWLLEQDFEIDDQLIANFYNGVDSGEISIKDNRVLNKDGNEFSIIHMNGNTKTKYALTI